MSRPDVPGLALYDVNKICKACRKEWTGKSFKPPPDDELAVVETLCDDCLEGMESSYNRAELLMQLERLMSQNPGTRNQKLAVASQKHRVLAKLRDTYPDDHSERHRMDARVEVAKMELEDLKRG